MSSSTDRRTRGIAASPGTHTATAASWTWCDQDPQASSPDDGIVLGVGDTNFQSTFAFVQSLAAELSRGRVDLPTCPDVASGVQQALERTDETLSNTLMTRVITSDAGLAANVLAVVDPRSSQGTRPRTHCPDFKLAVTRVGPDKVRSAALPYVLGKLHSAQAHTHLRDELARLWERSTLVAAIARELAKRTRTVSPDDALLAGLLHNVGGVYLVARAENHLDLFRDPAVRDLLFNDWQAPIGKAIAQNWGLPEPIAEAIGDQGLLERHEAGSRDLTDVLCVAVRAAAFFDQPDNLEIALASLPLFQRLAMDCRTLHEAMRDAASEIARLRAALGC